MTQPVYVLGGSQTDFAENGASAGKGIYDLLESATVVSLIVGKE
jgi:hypothetical protein